LFYIFSYFFPLSHDRTDNYIVAWKRGIAIISAGSVKVTPDPRVRLTNNYGLEIHEAAPQDAGDYICQIATMEPREITHTVEILGKFCHIVSCCKGSETDGLKSTTKNLNLGLKFNYFLNLTELD
jgi:hypothetical protein